MSGLAKVSSTKYNSASFINSSSNCALVFFCEFCFNVLPFMFIVTSLERSSKNQLMAGTVVEVLNNIRSSAVLYSIQSLQHYTIMLTLLNFHSTSSTHESVAKECFNHLALSLFTARDPPASDKS